MTIFFHWFFSFGRMIRNCTMCAPQNLLSSYQRISKLWLYKCVCVFSYECGTCIRKQSNWPRTKYKKEISKSNRNWINKKKVQKKNPPESVIEPKENEEVSKCCCVKHTEIEFDFRSKMLVIVLCHRPNRVHFNTHTLAHTINNETEKKQKKNRNECE